MTTTQTTPRLGHYTIDPSASTITFATRHIFGLAGVTGSFAIRSGIVDVVEPMSASRVEVEVDAASFATGSGARDTQVRSRRFLAAAEYPVLGFASQAFDGQKLSGTLTVKGVAAPITLQVEESTTNGGEFRARAGGRVDRYEYGITASRGMAARYLDIEVNVLCRLQ